MAEFDLLEFLHKSFSTYDKLFLRPKLNIDFSKYWSHESGMDVTRFPSFGAVLILKNRIFFDLRKLSIEAWLHKGT
ncbi:hypothetical protein [Acinetobacter sp. NS-4]|uniref:hypothetical protein n=1 Tax=Acinetobacter sp. NS-4 TaxID=3127956 RepID=UPI00307E8EED